MPADQKPLDEPRDPSRTAPRSRQRPELAPAAVPRRHAPRARSAAWRRSHLPTSPSTSGRSPTYLTRGAPVLGARQPRAVRLSAALDAGRQLERRRADASVTCGGRLSGACRPTKARAPRRRWSRRCPLTARRSDPTIQDLEPADRERHADRSIAPLGAASGVDPDNARRRAVGGPVLRAVLQLQPSPDEPSAALADGRASAATAASDSHARAPAVRRGHSSARPELRAARRPSTVPPRQAAALPSVPHDQEHAHRQQHDPSHAAGRQRLLGQAEDAGSVDGHATASSWPAIVAAVTPPAPSSAPRPAPWSRRRRRAGRRSGSTSAGPRPRRRRRSRRRRAA